MVRESILGLLLLISINYEFGHQKIRQYWIYANTDNELATVHIKVDCE